MSNFQLFVGFPQVREWIFEVQIKDSETGEIGWREYVPGKSPKDAELKARDALLKLGEENDFYKKYTAIATGNFVFARYNGRELPNRWARYGVIGRVPDEYVPVCKGGGVNLHIFKLGRYRFCWDCPRRETCHDESLLAGEQTEP